MYAFYLRHFPALTYYLPLLVKRYEDARGFWRGVGRTFPPSLLINLGIALLLTTAFLPWTQLGNAAVACQIIGISKFVTITLVRRMHMNRETSAASVALAHLLVSVPAGYLLGIQLCLVALPASFLDAVAQVPAYNLIALAIGETSLACLLIYLVLRLAEESQRTSRIELAAAQSTLRLLQAQTEPGFLFSALSTLDALLSQSPERARRLLGDLNGYLRASLIHARGYGATLDTEFNLLRAYLEIISTRYADISVSLECSPDCAGLPFPPMLVQPLVENAVLRCSQAQRGSCLVSLRAWRTQDTLEIEVRDAGMGLPHPGDSAAVLSSVRMRLGALFGGGATLAHAHHARGQRVVLQLPVQALIDLPAVLAASQ